MKILMKILMRMFAFKFVHLFFGLHVPDVTMGRNLARPGTDPCLPKILRTRVFAWPLEGSISRSKKLMDIIGPHRLVVRWNCCDFGI